MSVELRGILIDLSDFTVYRLIPLAAIVVAVVLVTRWLKGRPNG